MPIQNAAAPPGRGDTRLLCRVCRAGTKLVTRTQQFLKVKSKKRLHVATQCSNCLREAWSRHPAALRIGRLLDDEARVQAEL